jgi:hypothetical protein
VVKKPQAKSSSGQVALNLSELVNTQLEKLHLKVNKKKSDLREKCRQNLLEPEGKLFADLPHSTNIVTTQVLTKVTSDLQKTLNQVYDSSYGLRNADELAKYLAELKIIGEVIAFNVTDEFDLTYQSGFSQVLEAYKHRIKKYLLSKV